MKWKNTFLVGVYKCEMTYSKADGMHADWTPDVPDRTLSEQEQTQYRAGRDALMSEVGKALGGSVLIIET